MPLSTAALVIVVKKGTLRTSLLCFYIFTKIVGGTVLLLKPANGLLI